MTDHRRTIHVTYTNWRGRTRTREVLPQSVRYGATKHCPQPQWLLTAIDVETGESRDFALQDCDFTQFLTEEAT